MSTSSKIYLFLEARALKRTNGTKGMIGLSHSSLLVHNS